MASPGEHTLTFLRGSGFLLSLVGVWDLMADESSPWPSQKGFLIFKETKITAVIALMCALSAYVSYPSANLPGGVMPSLALSMQESRSLPIEAYDAV